MRLEEHILIIIKSVFFWYPYDWESLNGWKNKRLSNKKLASSVILHCLSSGMLKHSPGHRITGNSGQFILVIFVLKGKGNRKKNGEKNCKLK